MKTINTKLAAFALAGLAAGSAYAQEQQVVVDPRVGANRMALEELVARGYLTQLEDPSKFQVSKERTEELLAPGAIQSKDARRTMDLLQGLIGDKTDIRKVDVINARFGTQDVAS